MRSLCLTKRAISETRLAPDHGSCQQLFVSPGSATWTIDPRHSRLYRLNQDRRPSARDWTLCRGGFASSNTLAPRCLVLDDRRTRSPNEKLVAITGCLFRGEAVAHDVFGHDPRK